jgi:hypothetical protein
LPHLAAKLLDLVPESLVLELQLFDDGLLPYA